MADSLLGNFDDVDTSDFEDDSFEVTDDDEYEDLDTDEYEDSFEDIDTDGFDEEEYEDEEYEDEYEEEPEEEYEDAEDYQDDNSEYGEEELNTLGNADNQSNIDFGAVNSQIAQTSLVGDDLTEDLDLSDIDTDDFEDAELEETSDTETADQGNYQDTEDVELAEQEIKSASFTDEFGNIVVQENSKDSQNFTLEYIPIQNIAVPATRARKDAGVDELVTSIKNTGLLCPIVVIPLTTEGNYALIKGKRRLLACAKTGMKKVPCIVNTKVRTTELPILEVLYNHYRAYNINEIIDYIDYLEKEKGINRGDTIEYLLQLNSGDYAKLKDILTDNDEDIVNPLLQGQSTIEKAFKALEKRRKNETKEQQQQDKAEKVFGETKASGLSGVEDSGEDAGEANLTDEEIKEMGINLNSLDDSVEEKTLDEMAEEGKQMKGFEPHQQDVKHREYIDPAIKKAVLARDNNHCKCCGLGGESYVNQLDIHHVIPVFLGGKDDVDSAVTLCILCHSQVHSWSTGELTLPKTKTEEELKALSEEERVLYEFEQKKFKKIVKLGNYIREGMQRKGIKKEALRKTTRDVNPGRNKPGQGQKADL
jgi:hypothetical protein